MIDRLLRTLACQPHDRVPFVPAVYEHKAWFVGSTPSVVCRDATLLFNAMLAEYDQLRPDALVVGIDVYNVEAEAAGCTVAYREEGDSAIPAIAAGSEVFHEGDDVGALRMPDPLKNGRMPLCLEVARRIRDAVGKDIPVRGAVSGPFSLAASLAGAENLFTMIYTDPEAAQNLLLFAAALIQRYGEAFIRAGCGVIMFDSQASPELLSPALYRALVLGPTRDAIRSLHRAGLEHVPLIIGGNTTPLLDAYLETGANNILCDAPADAAAFQAACSKAGRAFRRNISSSSFLEATPDQLHEAATTAVVGGKQYPGFILGTGVVPFGTPLRNLLAMRTAVEESGKLD